jgi:spore germination protein GerM
MVWQKYRSSQVIRIAPPQQQSEGRRSVILFFAADMAKLGREARDIDPCEDDNACLKSVLEELQNGPVGKLGETVPEGTVIDAVRIEGNQATIELNRVFAEAMLSGSSAEMLAVYSIVNTVAANFPQVQKVKLNIDGNRAVLLRHLDLSEPLPPDYSMELSPARVSE